MNRVDFIETDISQFNNFDEVNMALKENVLKMNQITQNQNQLNSTINNLQNIFIDTRFIIDKTKTSSIFKIPENPEKGMCVFHQEQNDIQ